MKKTNAHISNSVSRKISNSELGPRLPGIISYTGRYREGRPVQGPMWPIVLSSAVATSYTGLVGFLCHPVKSKYEMAPPDITRRILELDTTV